MDLWTSLQHNKTSTDPVLKHRCHFRHKCLNNMPEEVIHLLKVNELNLDNFRKCSKSQMVTFYIHFWPLIASRKQT